MVRAAFAVVVFMGLLAPLVTSELVASEPEAGPITVAPNDWPWWRGPQRNGNAAAAAKPPLKWADTDHIKWKSPIPGKGYGSPIVVGEHVFLPTAEPAVAAQYLLCFQRQSGKLLWQTQVHVGGVIQKANPKSSLASSTPACDGRRVFVNFLHDGAIFTTALGLDGKKLWQTKVTDYTLHQGFGSSPALYEGLVIVSADNKGKGLIAGLERATGKVVWKQERPKLPNYASPIILEAAGRVQAFLIGCDLVTSLDPLTGTKIWEIPGATTECVTSTVTDGQLMFTSGGFPKKHMAAVRADGSGKVVWENKTQVYVPSMLLRSGHLYGVQDRGIAACWKADTGVELWRADLGGAVTASPVLVDDLIYATGEAGRTTIFKASPAGFELIAENQLGNEVLATPAICGGRIYMRVAHRNNGERQEMLYCLGD